MKKIVFAALAMAFVWPAAAQDTYESARLLGEDLNGTARYVGMGGAMEALGADISTISSNPAGLGMIRHTTANMSFGFVSQQGVDKFDNLGTTNMSFDQLGVVFANILDDDDSSVNFGFNYHKSRNFDQILSAANRLNGASLNGLTYHKAEIGSPARGGFELGKNNQGDVMGWDGDLRAYTYSQLDYLNANVLLLDPADHNFYAMDADEFNFDRAHRGYISNFDFNLSGNVNDRFYWGFTIGMKDVRYKGYSEYAEGFVGETGDLGYASYGDLRTIKGTGAEATAGIIFLPVEESPFRIGLSISTPTWFDLKSENTTLLLNSSKYGAWDEGNTSECYEYKFFTPWKFGLSLGHTVGQNLALGLSYQYSDYGASKNRVNDGYDSYGNEDSFTDEPQKRNAEASLKGVHTIKVGAEFKPVPELAVRLGYNYVSAAYATDGVRDMKLNSPGVMYASTADYVNWKGTSRITSGVGFRAGRMNVDLAYQYSLTNGDFHPMQPFDGYVPVATSVNNKRHQLLLTLGYTF